jgi:hypothetical protein
MHDEWRSLFDGEIGDRVLGDEGRSRKNFKPPQARIAK